MNKELSKNTSLFHTRTEHIINMIKKIESDMVSKNKDVIINIDLRTLMEELNYNCFEKEYGGYKVILEFPNTEDEDGIKEDVKQLMTNLLQEQIHQVM